MYTFPTDSEVRKQWIQFCGRGPRWCPLFSSKVCHLHFTPDDFTISGRVKAGSVCKEFSEFSEEICNGYCRIKQETLQGRICFICRSCSLIFLPGVLDIDTFDKCALQSKTRSMSTRYRLVLS